MIELRPSPFKPGKAISCSTQQFYHLYKDGKIVDRTLYSRYNYAGDENKNMLVLNKRTIAEIKPSVLNVCRRRYKHYPKYTMIEDIVVVNKETGKIIFDTNVAHIFDNNLFIISDYIFKYHNTLYNNKGEVIKTLNKPGIVRVLENTIIAFEGYSYKCGACYVFDKFGKLLNEYK